MVKKTYKRYYFDYLPVVKGNKIGKRRHSKSFITLSAAKNDAKKRWKQNKIIQAQFWDAKNIIGHKIVGSLNTRGKLQSRMFS